MTLKCTLKPVNMSVWLNQWLPIFTHQKSCFELNARDSPYYKSVYSDDLLKASKSATYNHLHINNQ